MLAENAGVWRMAHSLRLSAECNGMHESSIVRRYRSSVLPDDHDIHAGNVEHGPDKLEFPAAEYSGEFREFRNTVERPRFQSGFLVGGIEHENKTKRPLTPPVADH